MTTSPTERRFDESPSRILSLSFCISDPAHFSIKAARPSLCRRRTFAGLTIASASCAQMSAFLDVAFNLTQALGSLSNLIEP